MNEQRRPLTRQIAYLLLRLLVVAVAGLVRLLPLRWLRRLATGVACMLRILVPSRQRVAQENIRHVFGDRFDAEQRRQIAFAATTNICKTMIELLKMRYLSAQQITKMVSLRGQQHLWAALGQGKGVILLTAHFGNWEMGGARLAIEGFPVVAVVRDATEQLAADLINEARQHQGITVLARDDLRDMLRALHDNQCLAILPDQHVAEGGIVVDFLGRPAATAIGPAILAVRTGCAVVPLFGVRRPDDTIDGYILPPLELLETGDRDHDVRENTEMINRTIGEQIREHPEQWLWLHRRWKVEDTAQG